MQLNQRQTAGPYTADYRLLLAESAFWRAIPDVRVQRMNVEALCEFSTHGMKVRITASGVSTAENALASHINRPWGTGGTVQPVVSRNCERGSDGERAVSRLSREYAR
jgi:hypothetical protein